MSEPTKEWDLDVVLEARANKHRRQFVYALGLMPHFIHQLAELCNLSLPIIHKHIKILERAGRVLRKKFSRTNVLTLRQSALQVLQDWLGQFHTYWETDDATSEKYTQFVHRKNQNGAKSEEISFYLNWLYDAN